MEKSRPDPIRFRGKDRTTLGPALQVGQAAPDFVATGRDWSVVRPIADAAGKVRVLAAVPSLDTSVCDKETRRFNEEAAALDPDIRIYVLSTDLPFALERWCGAAAVDRVTTLSDHNSVDFGMKYGCLLDEARVLRRAVFVVDRKGVVVYADYMTALSEEPNYEEVLAEARKAL
jgi:thiol peroxidase